MSDSIDSTILSTPTVFSDGQSFVMPSIKAVSSDAALAPVDDTDTSPTDDDQEDTYVPEAERDCLPSQRGMGGIGEALKMGFDW